MKYTNLGKSDLNVSRICMGCMGFGNAATGQHSWTIGEEETREIIKHGLDLGINFYDTAIVYQNGTSEQFVGKALRDLAKRDDYVIATKFTPRTQDEIDNGVTGQQHIENYLNKSLQNLGLDYVDLYIYHMWDYHTPMEEIMDGLHNAVKSENVDAPIINEFPICMECEFIEYGDCGVIGKVINTSVDESVMDGDKVDIEKLSAIAFDPYTHGYYTVTKRVGNAFKDGLQLK